MAAVTTTAEANDRDQMSDYQFNFWKRLFTWLFNDVKITKGKKQREKKRKPQATNSLRTSGLKWFFFLAFYGHNQMIKTNVVELLSEVKKTNAATKSLFAEGKTFIDKSAARSWFQIYFTVRTKATAIIHNESILCVECVEKYECIFRSGHVCCFRWAIFFPFFFRLIEREKKKPNRIW